MSRLSSMFRPKRAAKKSQIGRDEAFRVLRSNLLVALTDLRNPVVIITSAIAGEGKTSTATALAWSLAAAGRRTVLVDLDFRNPSAHRPIGADNNEGASDVLAGRKTLEECLQYIDITEPHRQVGGLYFLAAGGNVENPAELLSGDRTARLLNLLSSQADVVIVDTPPVLPVADTLVIGRHAAGALLVVEGGRTLTPVVNRAKDALTRNQTRILGVVLNKMESDGYGHGYGYGYGYGYGRTSSEPTPVDPT